MANAAFRPPTIAVRPMFRPCHAVPRLRNRDEKWTKFLCYYLKSNPNHGRQDRSRLANVWDRANNQVARIAVSQATLKLESGTGTGLRLPLASGSPSTIFDAFDCRQMSHLRRR